MWMGGVCSTKVGGMEKENTSLVVVAKMSDVGESKRQRFGNSLSIKQEILSVCALLSVNQKRLFSAYSKTE